MTENEVPWSRGRRETQKRKGDDSYCVLIQPDERTTGERFCTPIQFTANFNAVKKRKTFK